MPTLGQRLGGPPAIRTVVDGLYCRLAADALVSPFFDSIDMRRLQAHMVDFLAAALDIDHARYLGRDMRAGHSGLGITDEVFDRVADHLVDTLQQEGVAPADVDAVVERIAPLRDQIVTQPLDADEFARHP